MATVSVELPDEVSQFVSEKIAAGKYESPGEFIVALLAACQQRETIETKLLAAVESNDFQEVTPDLWKRLRKRAAETVQVSESFANGLRNVTWKNMSIISPKRADRS